jgi:hypothetical protein
MGEIAVCLEVMDRGGEALRNVSPHAKNDLCLIVSGTVIQVDVKVAQWKPGGQCWNATAASSVKHPVYPVVVTPIGLSYREWQFRWHKDNSGKYKCPPGLENFWD